MIKTIERDGREWAWPEYDTELIKVFDQHQDIARILPYVTDFSACIQAGGACGVWPYYLQNSFERVFTFEPDAVNYSCLKKNAPDSEHFNAALGDGYCGSIDIRRDDCEKTNAGAGYITPGKGVLCLQIDELNLESCGLIQLDVEGAECVAILGGEKTIKNHRPVIVIEEKALPHNPSVGDARLILKAWGYREREKIHRDVIFTC